MNSPKLIAERRFSTVREFTLALQAIAWNAPEAYIKAWSPHDESPSPYAGIIRLFEDTLTDGSKVYEVHIA